MQQHPGIQAPRPRPHHQPLQRLHPHGGVDTAPGADRRHAGPVAQMQADQVEALRRPAQQPSRLAHHGLVRDAVKAVAPHPMLPEPGLGHGVAVGIVGQGGMEVGVEHRKLRRPRQQFHGCRRWRRVMSPSMTGSARWPGSPCTPAWRRGRINARSSNGCVATSAGRPLRKNDCRLPRMATSGTSW
jgi:hypothetical protein